MSNFPDAVELQLYQIYPAQPMVGDVESDSPTTSGGAQLAHHPKTAPPSCVYPWFFQ